MSDVHIDNMRFDERGYRRVKKNSARIRELEGHNEALIGAQQQAALTKVKNIEDWIWLVQTRTQALELLEKFRSIKEVEEFLAMIEARSAK